MIVWCGVMSKRESVSGVEWKCGGVWIWKLVGGSVVVDLGVWWCGCVGIVVWMWKCGGVVWMWSAWCGVVWWCGNVLMWTWERCVRGVVGGTWCGRQCDSGGSVVVWKWCCGAVEVRKSGVELAVGESAVGWKCGGLGPSCSIITLPLLSHPPSYRAATTIISPNINDGFLDATLHVIENDCFFNRKPLPQVDDWCGQGVDIAV